MTRCQANDVNTGDNCVDVDIKDGNLEYNVPFEYNNGTHSNLSISSLADCPLSRTAAMFERYSIYNAKVKIENLNFVKLNEFSDNLVSRIIGRKLGRLDRPDPKTNFNILKE